MKRVEGSWVRISRAVGLVTELLEKATMYVAIPGLSKATSNVKEQVYVELLNGKKRQRNCEGGGEGGDGGIPSHVACPVQSHTINNNGLFH